MRCSGFPTSNRAMRSDNDIAILGGGCAGLSLAMRLADSGAEGPSVAVLEGRALYAPDRTWCFWDDGNARLRHLVQHRWSSVAVADHRRRVTVDCRAAPYQMIPAAAFYSAATQAIAKTSRIELAMNETVIAEPQKEDRRWRIETSTGVRYAKQIIDTRPPPRLEGESAILWQSFSGHEVACDAACFDPESATLMDFSSSHKGEIAFLYLLPFSKHRALIEATVFAPKPLGPSELADRLGRLVRQCVGEAGFSVLRSEHGILPMGQAAPAQTMDATFVRAGVVGGAVRAASGFAFQRIQRWAEDCAAALLAGQPPRAHAPDPWLRRTMDGLFLRVLRARPDLAPDLFLKLFAMKDPGHIIRFMSDCPTLADYAAIVSALPAGPFLREIPRRLSGSSRRSIKGRAAG
jgi:lycopene beta-cyclase